VAEAEYHPSRKPNQRKQPLSQPALPLSLKRSGWRISGILCDFSFRSRAGRLAPSPSFLGIVSTPTLPR
jgi:hypothetical protein